MLTRLSRVKPFALHETMVPAAAVSVLSIVALHPPEQLSLGGKLAVSAYSLVFYLEKTLMPARLSPLYGLPNEVDPFAVRFLASYVTLTVIVAVAWLLRRRLPGAIAVLVPPLVVLFTGLITIPGPFAIFRRRLAREREALSVCGARWA